MSHLLQTEKHILSGVHQVYIQCLASVHGGVDEKNVWLDLFFHHFLDDETICWINILLSMSR